MVKRLCSLTICWKKKKKEDLYKDFFKSYLKIYKGDVMLYLACNVTMDVWHPWNVCVD